MHPGTHPLVHTHPLCLDVQLTLSVPRLFSLSLSLLSFTFSLTLIPCARHPRGSLFLCWILLHTPTPHTAAPTVSTAMDHTHVHTHSCTHSPRRWVCNGPAQISNRASHSVSTQTSPTYPSRSAFPSIPITLSGWRLGQDAGLQAWVFESQPGPARERSLSW